MRSHYIMKYALGSSQVFISCAAHQTAARLVTVATPLNSEYQKYPRHASPLLDWLHLFLMSLLAASHPSPASQRFDVALALTTATRATSATSATCSDNFSWKRMQPDMCPSAISLASRLHFHTHTHIHIHTKTVKFDADRFLNDLFLFSKDI